MDEIRTFEVVSALAASNHDVSSDVNGNNVNLAGYANPGSLEIKAVLNATNTGGDADETLDVKVQEADDDGAGSPDTWDDISGAAFGQKDDSADDAQESIHFRTNKEWIRVVAVGGGTTPVFDAAVMFVLKKVLT